jgi:hypothetical protein
MRGAADTAIAMANYVNNSSAFPPYGRCATRRTKG